MTGTQAQLVALDPLVARVPTGHFCGVFNSDNHSETTDGRGYNIDETEVVKVTSHCLGESLTILIPIFGRLDL